MFNILYPRCRQFGLKVTDAGDYSVVTDAEIDRVFPTGTLERKRFAEYYGVQTRVSAGLYAWDVEAVLERMASGKLTGTQLDPD